MPGSSALGWREEAREYVRERRPVHERFFARAAASSFLVGGLLPLVCVRNFASIADPSRARGRTSTVSFICAYAGRNDPDEGLR